LFYLLDLGPPKFPSGMLLKNDQGTQNV